MQLLKPFSFSPFIQGRKHGPGGYANYQDYKDWLRDEFEFRCIYCLERETWYPSRHAAFAVEHILPQSKRPDLVCDYDNLGYACLRCNSFKQDIETLDPSRIALDEHLYFEPDGSAVGRTDEGREFIFLFHLNEVAACNLRKEKLSILQLKNRYPDDSNIEMLFRNTFGYPQNLPDLRWPAKQPKTNSRHEGVHECHFVRKLEGRLAEVY
jgi:HNH endonuclease